MALEDLTGTKYIDDLNSSNPAAGDNVSEGDDHIRGIKNVLKTTFPSIDGAITATDTELNYVDGVTSAIQTQLDSPVAKGDGSSADGYIQLNCSQNSHGIKLQSPPHSAGASYTLVFPNDDGDANQYLQTNGSGVLDWNTVDLTTLSATNLTSGTVPSARITASSIANDLIDSQHYADGSIDTAHIADSQITSAKIANGTIVAADIANDTITNTQLAANSVHASELADDAVDTAAIADDAVTQAKIADEAVNEARLQISNAGTNGYFLQKQSGNTGGLTWAEVVSEDFIPNGSVMAFFQASAPTGWTQVTTQNDKTLRVVSGTGGGTGGDWAMSAGETTSSHGGHVHAGAAHSHNHNLSAGSHTLSTNEIPAHSHSVPYANHTGNSGSSYFSNAFYRPNYSYRSGGNHSTNNTGGGGGHSHSLAGSIVSGGAGDTSSAGSHTHTIAAPQYIDVIICSKDA